jgi:hypothetical protein
VSPPGVFFFKWNDRHRPDQAARARSATRSRRRSQIARASTVAARINKPPGTIIAAEYATFVIVMAPSQGRRKLTLRQNVAQRDFGAAQGCDEKPTIISTEF